MATIYDWITVAAFAGLILLFLQRSVQTAEPRDHMWQYIIAAIGCAAVNYLGNNSYHVAAGAALLLVGAFVFRVLRPFDRGDA